MLQHLTANEYTIRDTFSFVDELTNQPASGTVMASFDIEALFTNIPINETIDIILTSIFKHNITKYHNFSKSDFRQLLEFAVKQNFFIFNGVLYQQTDGVGMGVPLGPTFANIFLAYHERNWLKNAPSAIKPIHYRRYVDDCFMLFRDGSHVDAFLAYLNTCHRNMRFTAETEVGNNLSFLDVSVLREGNSFSTSVYRKKTFTGLFSHFESFIPDRYKFNLVMCLLDRGFKICSSFPNFAREINTLAIIFAKNGYPRNLFNKCARLFLNKSFGPINRIPSVAKLPYTVVLPYTGNHSNLVRNKLAKLLSRAYPFLQIKFIFKPQCRISSLFGFKDRIAPLLRSHVVYRFNCSGCSATYIGHSARHLTVRVGEHIGLSWRTNKRCKPLDTAVSEHLIVSNHQSAREDFEILGECQFVPDLKILESLAIYKFKPSLNRYETSTPLYLF